MRRHVIAVLGGVLVFPATSASGQDSRERCPDMMLENCVKKYWAKGRSVSSAWQDTMDTWTAAADWQDTEDCSKVRNVAKQVIVFGNREIEDATLMWPMIEEIFWAHPKTAGAHGEHFHDESWFINIPGETPDDSVQHPAPCDGLHPASEGEGEDMGHVEARERAPRRVQGRGEGR